MCREKGPALNREMPFGEDQRLLEKINGRGQGKDVLSSGVSAEDSAFRLTPGPHQDFMISLTDAWQQPKELKIKISFHFCLLENAKEAPNRNPQLQFSDAQFCPSSMFFWFFGMLRSFFL